MSWDKSKDELRDQVVRQTNVRKKTGHWCKGKVGKEHDVELIINHNYSATWMGCKWTELMAWRNGERSHWKWHYHCRHSYRCKSCGKYTEWTLKNKEECPDFKPKPEQPAP